MGLGTTTVAPADWSLQTVDLSCDGRPDVLDSNGNDVGVTALRGDGAGGFDWQRTWWQGHNAYRSGVADFNLDGRLDVIAPSTNGVHAGVLLSDTTPPVTTHDADAVWHGEDVTVNFSATDEPDGWGLGKTEYSTDGGSSWTEASGLTITADPSGVNDGAHDFLVRSQDQVGNLEDPPVSGQVLIDTQGPTTTSDAPADWMTAPATVNFSAVDAGSGVRYTQYRVDGGPWVRATSATIVSDGVHRLEFRSVDRLYNVEPIQSTLVRVGAYEVHVSPAGSDTTGLGTAAEPFLTIGHATGTLIGHVGPGETIYVHAGTYAEDVDMAGGVKLLGDGAASTTIVGSGTRAVVACSSMSWGATVSGLTITGGGGADGGGISFYGVGGTSTVSDCDITDNHCSYRGGGIRVDYCDAVLIERCSITANSAGYAGGGVATEDVGGFTLRDTTIAGNECRGNHGGGGALWDGDSVTIERCRFVRNEARQWVGALMVWQTGSASVSDTLFADNFTSWGDLGTIAFFNMLGPSTVERSTFSGNASYGGAVSGLGSPAVAVNNCILQDGVPGWPELVNANATYCNILGGAPGVGNFDKDPLFVDPAAGDYHLQEDSPCIGNGDPAYSGPDWDLDQIARPQVDHVNRLGGSSMLDVGCYERPCFTIEWGDASTWHARVELDSFFSQATEMRFRNPGGEWCDWEPYDGVHTDWPLDLSGGDGTKSGRGRVPLSRPGQRHPRPAGDRQHRLRGLRRRHDAAGDDRHRRRHGLARRGRRSRRLGDRRPFGRRPDADGLRRSRLLPAGPLDRHGPGRTRRLQRRGPPSLVLLGRLGGQQRDAPGLRGEDRHAAAFNHADRSDRWLGEHGVTAHSRAQRRRQRCDTHPLALRRHRVVA